MVDTDEIKLFEYNEKPFETVWNFHYLLCVIGCTSLSSILRYIGHDFITILRTIIHDMAIFSLMFQYFDSVSQLRTVINDHKTIPIILKIL